MNIRLSLQLCSIEVTHIDWRVEFVVRVTIQENSCIPVRYMYRRQITVTQRLMIEISRRS